MNLLFSNRISKEVADLFISRSNKIGVEPDWSTFLSEFESGLDAYRENSFGCFSWIQFCPDFSGGNYKTINGKQYYFSDLKTWSPVQLLNLSFDYIEEQQNIHGRFADYYEMYFAILFPEAINKPDEYVLNTQSNPIFDLNKDGKIMVAEVKQFLDNRVKEKVPQGYWNTFFKKKNFLQLYKREIIIGSIIVAGIFVLIWLYKKITE